jgi:hypothetical protein
MAEEMISKGAGKSGYFELIGGVEVGDAQP